MRTPPWLIAATVALTGCADILDLSQGTPRGQGGTAADGGGGGGGFGGDTSVGGTGGITTYCPYAAAVLSNDPASYWRLADTADTAADEIGAEPGERWDAPATVSSIIPTCPDNGAVQFPDSLDAIDIGDVYGFSGTLPFTVEAWVQVSDNPRAGSIISKLNENDGWRFHLDQSGNVRFGRRINVANQDGQFPLPTSTPHHIVGVYDPLVPNGEVCLYLDGGIPDCTSSGAPLDAIPDALRFSDSPFGGILDDVAIYERALDAATVRAHCNAGFGDSRCDP